MFRKQGEALYCIDVRDGAEAPPCMLNFNPARSITTGLDDEVGCSGEIQAGQGCTYEDEVTRSGSTATRGRSQVDAYIRSDLRGQCLNLVKRQSETAQIDAIIARIIKVQNGRFCRGCGDNERVCTCATTVIGC